jgi:hypothetical protein
MKKIIVASSVSALVALLVATVAYSYNITHPKLQDAYNLADQAIKDIHEAFNEQKASGVDFGGHLESAIDGLQKVQAR